MPLNYFFFNLLLFGISLFGKCLHLIALQFRSALSFVLHQKASLQLRQAVGNALFVNLPVFPWSRTINASLCSTCFPP